MRPAPALLVFSHLRWNFVYQRPQHLLSRLAAGRRVLFVEEPVHDESTSPHWVRDRPAANVLVCRPHTPLRSPGFSDEQMPALAALVRQLVHDEGLDDHVAWFYTP